jgi:hypothetical protein
MYALRTNIICLSIKKQAFLNYIILIGVHATNTYKLSNGHSPQIRQNGELLVRMCRGESHFSQKTLWQM